VFTGLVNMGSVYRLLLYDIEVYANANTLHTCRSNIVASTLLLVWMGLYSAAGDDCCGPRVRPLQASRVDLVYNSVSSEQR